MKKLMYGFLLGLCVAVPAAAQQRPLNIDEHVQRAVENERFGDAAITWESARIHNSHFVIRNDKLECPAVRTALSLVMSTTCFFPIEGGRAVPEERRLLQEVIFTVDGGATHRLNDLRFKKVNGYVAVPLRTNGTVELTGGTLCYSYQSQDAYGSPCAEAVMEGDKVYVPNTLFKAHNAQLLRASFLDYASNTKKELALQVSSDGQWSVLTVKNPQM